MIAPGGLYALSVSETAGMPLRVMPLSAGTSFLPTARLDATLESAICADVSPAGELVYGDLTSRSVRSFQVDSAGRLTWTGESILDESPYSIRFTTL